MFERRAHFSLRRLRPSVVVTASLADVSPVQAISTTLVISEFRVRGPNGANDEFIEIQNISSADITVADSGAGTGFGVAASDGVARCVIPNGTVIPRYGHYLCVNSVGYSLAAYPAGNGTTATGDATYTTDIPDNAGIALFDSSVPANFDVAHQIDAVGSSSEANLLYKEGTGYPALTPFSIDYSFYRNLSTPQIASTAIDTATPGISEDTDDNATDFVFVDTNGTSAGAGQRLGAPGPENLSSPVVNGGLSVALLDPCVDENTSPNAVFDATSDPGNNSTFGTVEFRRTITNNTGGNVTRLRFRIADQRTFPAPSGWADMRNRTSSSGVVNVDRVPCGSGNSNVTVNGTTLEQPPSQPNGDAFNSSMSAGVVTLGTPLTAGASIDVRLLFGLQQLGNDSVRIVVEALSSGSTTTPSLTCLGMTAAGILNVCNLVPVGVTDNYAGTEDTPLVVAAAGVLANDSDPEGQPITVDAGSVSVPTSGSVVVDADGSFTYTPNANFNGADSFTYRATDGSLDSSDTTVNLTIAAINDAPVAVSDVATTIGNAPLTRPAPGPLANDTDVDGGPLTAILVTAPSHGTVSLAPDGSYVYTPNPGFVGTDSFSYAAFDGAVASNAATVTVTVTAPPAGNLPTTGTDLRQIILMGAALTLIGASMLGARRRRDRSLRSAS